MEVTRTIDRAHHSLRLYVRASFDGDEATVIDRFGLRDILIQPRGAVLRGRHRVSRAHQASYRAHLAKVKSRWNSALVSTTEIVPVDHLSSLATWGIGRLRSIQDLVLGRRYRLGDAIEGITIESARIGDLREAELAILTSLSAVGRAIDYARQFDGERRISAPDLVLELDGLDFAGAGGDLDDDIGRVTAAKVLLIAALIAVAAIAALHEAGQQLATTFDNVASAQGASDARQ